MRLHTYAAAIWQTMFTMYCAASLRDIGISQRANPVQNGSTSIVAGDVAGRACKSVAQQEEPAKAWRSRKSLQKCGAAERACKSVAQPAKAWRSRKSLQKRGAAGRACQSVAQQEESAKVWRSRKSLQKRGTAQEPRQAWRAKITLSIIGGLGNNISGETTTNHNHLEKIDTADETVSQYKAYDAIHLS